MTAIARAFDRVTRVAMAIVGAVLCTIAFGLLVACAILTLAVLAVLFLGAWLIGFQRIESWLVAR